MFTRNVLVTCASVRGQGNHGRPPLVSISLGGPFDCVGMDFVELDVMQDGNRYALVFQDYLTNFANGLKCMPFQTGKLKQWPDVCWTWYGNMECQTRLYMTEQQNFCQRYYKRQRYCWDWISYQLQGSPQTDDLVERFNCTLK